MKELTKTDYEKICCDLIDYQLIYNREESKRNIQLISQSIKLLEEQEKTLILKKPFLFQHHWKRKLEEIEEQKMKQYEMIGNELSYIESN